MKHELKIWPQYYCRVVDGSKTFAVRKNDRGFQPGDEVTLREWNPKTERVEYDNDPEGAPTYSLVDYVLLSDHERIVADLTAKLQERDREIEMLKGKLVKYIYEDSQELIKLKYLLAKAKEMASFYASPDVYTPFVTFAGERQPGVLTEQGRKARAFLKELEGM